MLFLDDLQWADAASLALIEDLMTQPETRHLLLIGAYRDNEVDAAHPLSTALDGDAQGRRARPRIWCSGRWPAQQLRPSSADALALRRPPRSVPLAELVHEKTGGNPFFAIQFLRTLHDERLIELDAAQPPLALGRRRASAAKGFTDNVVDLMVGKLERLPPATEAAMKRLACLGAGADLAVVGHRHRPQRGGRSRRRWPRRSGPAWWSPPPTGYQLPARPGAGGGLLPDPGRRTPGGAPAASAGRCWPDCPRRASPTWCSTSSAS